MRSGWSWAWWRDLSFASFGLDLGLMIRKQIENCSSPLAQAALCQDREGTRGGSDDSDSNP